jgi:hypothetical protein
VPGGGGRWGTGDAAARRWCLLSSAPDGGVEARGVVWSGLRVTLWAFGWASTVGLRMVERVWGWSVIQSIE